MQLSTSKPLTLIIIIIIICISSHTRCIWDVRIKYRKHSKMLQHKHPCQLKKSRWCAEASGIRWICGMTTVCSILVGLWLGCVYTCVCVHAKLWGMRGNWGLGFTASFMWGWTSPSSCSESMMWCLHVPQQRVQIHHTGEDEQFRKHKAKHEMKCDGEDGVRRSV